MERLYWYEFVLMLLGLGMVCQAIQQVWKKWIENHNRRKKWIEKGSPPEERPYDDFGRF